MELNVMEYLYQNIPTDWKTNSINPFLENFEVYHLSILLTFMLKGLHNVSCVIL